MTGPMDLLARMKPPITGGCLCGDFRYSCSGRPVWSVNCHCRSCQKLSGAPFVSAFAVRAEHFHQFGGEGHVFERDSESGHRVRTVHCQRCGTRMTAQSAGNRAIVNIFAATLDDPSTFAPISNVYLSEAAHWVVPDATLMAFQKMPGA